VTHGETMRSLLPVAAGLALAVVFSLIVSAGLSAGFCGCLFCVWVLGVRSVAGHGAMQMRAAGMAAPRAQLAYLTVWALLAGLGTVGLLGAGLAVFALNGELLNGALLAGATLLMAVILTWLLVSAVVDPARRHGFHGSLSARNDLWPLLRTGLGSGQVSVSSFGATATGERGVAAEQPSGAPLDSAAAAPRSQVQAGVRRTPAWKPAGIPTERPIRELSEVLADLDGLEGMVEAKQQFRSTLATIQREQVKAAADADYIPLELRLHSLFLGPPGTGKSTLARLWSEALGILGITDGRFFETKPADLITGGLGQAGSNTAKFLADAAGAFLFLDDAQGLLDLQGAGSDQGAEVIKAFVQSMTDPEGPLVGIATYAEEVPRILRLDRGLRSRIKLRFALAPYSAEQLGRIAVAKLRNMGRTVTVEAQDELGRAVAELLHYGTGEDFAAAREMENLAQFAAGAQSERVGEQVELDITAADIRAGLDVALVGLGAARSGRDEAKLAQAEQRLAELVGMAGPKAQLPRWLHAQLGRDKQRKANPDLQQSSRREHILLVGPPGTGKSTLAGVIAQYLEAAGLSNGVLIKTKPGELSKSVIGGTGEATWRSLDAARGGVWFCDDAQGFLDRAGDGADLGKEPFTAMLTPMNEDPNCPTVILSVYPEHEEALLAKEPGLRRRIKTTFRLDEYAPAEMCDIARLKVSRSGRTLTADADTGLQLVISELHARYASREAWTSGGVAEDLIAQVLGAQEERIADQDTDDLFSVEGEDIQAGTRAYIAAQQGR
jgi:SpoVK/Ycf46/Vps4 family AAA+-type ATPase